MRTDTEILDGLVLGADKEVAVVELLMDVRSLLQKLVERKKNSKVVTEMILSDAEQKLLDGLDEIQV